MLKTKRNDTTPWPFTLLDNGAGKSLDDATAVVLYMVDEDGETVIDGADVTPAEDQTSNPGLCTYAPTEEDVSTAGMYRAEVQVTWSDGTVSSFPSDGYAYVHIGEDLG